MTTAAEIDPLCFAELEEQYLLDIKVVMELEKVPPELIFNWDHIRINIIPGSPLTMKKKRLKQIEVAGLKYKQLQITAVFCASLVGEFLPVN